MRIKRQVLKNHGHVAMLRRQMIHYAAIDGHGSAAGIFQAGNKPERGGLARAGRAGQNHAVSIGRFQGKIVQGAIPPGKIFARFCKIRAAIPILLR